jgi:hypothetical protein
MNALTFLVGLGLGSALMGVGYRVSNGHVEYGTFDEGNGSQSHVIEGADAATFKVLADGDYAKDSRSAYWKGLRIQDADATSFRSISKYHAKDSQHVYFSQLLIPGADPATFVELTLQLAKDKTHAYDGWVSYELCDASTFHPLDAPGHWSVDRKCVYFARQVVAGADPATFSVVEGRFSEFAKDKHDVYRSQGSKAVAIGACDPDSFRLLDGGTFWQADNKCVYWSGKIIPGADGASFKLTGHFTGKDRNHAYASGKVAAEESAR